MEDVRLFRSERRIAQLVRWRDKYSNSGLGIFVSSQLMASRIASSHAPRALVHLKMTDPQSNNGNLVIRSEVGRHCWKFVFARVPFAGCESTSRNASEAPPPTCRLATLTSTYHTPFLPPERLQTLPLSVAATCSLMLLACIHRHVLRCSQ